jgi:hypothetical protein
MRRGSFNQCVSFVGRKYFSMSWGDAGIDLADELVSLAVYGVVQRLVCDRAFLWGSHEYRPGRDGKR